MENGLKTFYNLGSRLGFENYNFDRKKKEGGDLKRFDPRFDGINNFSKRVAKKLWVCVYHPQTLVS